MILVIGGYAQGKLAYVQSVYGIRREEVWDADLPQWKEQTEATVVINHLHDWIKKELAVGNSPERKIAEFNELAPNCIIISDEVGNGIVPVEPFEREYRERTGRILVELAKRAEGVVRVVCGIGQRIK